MFGMAFLLPMHASAQYIDVRTVPVATFGQFIIFPAQNFGMAGVSIALNDSILDPFENPAKGVRIRGYRFYISPNTTDATENSGMSRTLPMSVLFRTGRSFGGASLTLQRIRAAEKPEGSHTPTDRTENLYAFGLFGKPIAHSGTAIAASMLWSSLHAIQGVDLLYNQSERVEQNGHIFDFRVGLLREGAPNDAALDAVLFYNYIGMVQEIYRVYWNGSPAPSDRYEDKTHTVGLSLNAMRPVAVLNSNVGLNLTINYKNHPKIPNYELMNLPRDPGHTWAANLGAGIATHHDGNTFAADFVFEPIWSHTWSEARQPVRTSSHALIPAGGKTVDNTFVFTNWLIRLGLSEQGKVAGFQLGLQVRRMAYDFTQRNYVHGTKRSQHESWLEWYPSFSIYLNISSIQFRYAVRMTIGTGRPAVGRSGWINPADAMTLGPVFLVAPAGTLSLQEATIFTHQITLSLALGGKP